ncbi:MAG TPA: hypothetical protein DCR40_12860 [Prolixibacteraceae bacterium]|nr:hypothetical protein [Prolixibacteraceae bacterium]
MLFTSIDEIKQFLAVGAGTDFNRLKPHIQNAETAYLRPLLGAGLFKELLDFYDNPEADPPVENKILLPELLSLAQRSLIHLTYWSGFQVLNATISDGGFKRTENEKVKSLFKYQEVELKEYFKTTGFNGLDEILFYLEMEIKKSEGENLNFKSFIDSDAWTILKSSFIPDTSTFNSIVFINHSRLTFLRLKSPMQLVEDLDIKPVLGEAIFNEIKLEMVKKTPSAKVTAILPYIQKAIAYLATALLMEESGADLTEKGLYFESTDAYNNLMTNKQPAESDRINFLAKRNKGIGQNYLERLKSYFIANATDWPTYSGQTSNALRRNNTDKKSFWAC